MVINFTKSDKTINNPKAVFEVLKGYMKAQDKIDRDKEHFFVFHLDVRHKIKLLELVSVGTLTSTMVHPREVFTRAISARSAYIIIAHNHPSGVIEPSTDDIAITNRLQEAGKILDITVLDHIIISSKEFYSFKANGRM